MKKTIKSKLLMICIFVLFSLLVEIAMFAMLNNNIFPQYILLNICSMVLISSVIFLIPNNKWALIYLGIILFIQVILNNINCIMYDSCGDIFSVQYFKLFKEAARVFEFSFFNIGKILVFIALYAGYILLNVFLMKKNVIERKSSINYKSFIKKQIICFASALLVFTTTYAVQVEYIKAKNDDGIFSDGYLYSSLSLKVEGLKNFGTWGYYAKEMKNVFLTSSEINESKLVEVNDYLKKGEYQTTEYFGSMVDKNIIMIMMESVQWFAIDEYLTPTLYDLAYNGLSFSNYYSKNKTNISEMIGITGSYPVSNLLHPKNIEYNFSNSIINQLGDSYVSTYVHPNVGDFYQRDLIMNYLGFDNSYFYDSLFEEELYEWGDFPLDSISMENSLDYLIPETDDNFYSFFTTLSTHGPYNKSEKNIQLLTELGYFKKIDDSIEEGKWTNPLKDTEVEDSFRYYKAMAMDLDKAVSILIDKLTSEGILDDTVLVLYGDHNAYYDDISYLIYDSKGGDYYKPYIFKTPLIIYNEELTMLYKENNNINSHNGVEINKFVSTYNIVPTLLDLIGIKFNSNLYLGTSVFYEENYDLLNIFFSLQGGIFNDVIYTINGKDLVYTELKEYENELEKFRMASENFLNKLKYIEYIYMYNMFEEINCKIG